MLLAHVETKQDVWLAFERDGGRDSWLRGEFHKGGERVYHPEGEPSVRRLFLRQRQKNGQNGGGALARRCQSRPNHERTGLNFS